ncbi:MAG: sigma-54-dependent transcriptional regulator [Gammaproteobacteria bacterium]
MNTSEAERILVVDDEPGIRTAIGEILGDEGYEVALASGALEARRAFAAARPDLVLLDIWMEGEDGISLLKSWTKLPGGVPPVLMMSGHGTVDTAIEATRLGALDFIEKPVSLSKLLRMVTRALKTAPRRREPLGAFSLMELIGAHPSIARLRLALAAACGQAGPVLLTGEAGSGREMLARQLARKDRRAYVRIILSGAEPQDVRLRIEKPREPTLVFLNELGDASRAVQDLLLALLTHSGAGSGENRLRFAASIRPGADGEVKPDGLRRDLHDRFALSTIEVPPLREYSDYLPEVIRYYVDELADQDGYAFRRFGTDALNRLRRHDWPGNLRELNDFLKRVLASDSSEPVGLAEVDAVLGLGVSRTWRLEEDLLALPFREARDRFERAYLQAQLELAGGKVAALADRVGLERTHLYRKLKTLGVDLGGDERSARSD